MRSLRQAILLSFLSFTFADIAIDNDDINRNENIAIKRSIRNMSSNGNGNGNGNQTTSSPVPTQTPSSNVTTISSSPSVSPTLMPTDKNTTTSPSPTTTPTPSPTTNKPTTLSPTSTTPPKPRDHEWWNNIWKIILKTILWLFLAGLSVLLFSAVMSNRYRIYYYVRGLWYTFLHKIRRLLPSWRNHGSSSSANNAATSSTLNEIIFSDNNDLQEGLLMGGT